MDYLKGCMLCYVDEEWRVSKNMGMQQDECVYIGCIQPVSVRGLTPARRLASGIPTLLATPSGGGGGTMSSRTLVS